MSSNIIENIIKSISSIFKIDLSSLLIRKEIQKNYDEGLKDIELKLDVNFNGNKNKQGFLENYTFDNIKGMDAELAEKMRKEFSQGVLAGDSVAKMKKRVQEVMKVGVTRAKAIARTETNRAENAGRLDGAMEAEQQGIKTKKWLLVTQDTRTSPICHKEHSKYGSADKAIPIDENFVINYNGKIISEPHSPFHPNCRTRLMVEVIS
jgi:SPP1 gp7 family putative phage head morphogenesis protein